MKDKPDNLIVGKIGEDAACKYLASKGYKILHKNHRTRWSEIDIVAVKGDRLYFTEVRTKKDVLQGTPEETLNYRKIGKLIRAAYGYLLLDDYKYKKFQIDAICVVLNCEFEVARVSHYQNITL